MEEPEILIVDDNPEIREVAMVLLQGEGFTVDEAGDGKEALDKIEHGAYDLILLDVMMPGLNGYQTCMEIRKKSNVPILFLSARTQVEDKIMGFSSGGDDYLPKPFSYQELISRVKAWCGDIMYIRAAAGGHRKKKCAAELWKCIRKPELYGKTEKRFL